MEIVRRVHAMKEISRRARARGVRVGLVPTMGHLHEGHLSLVRRVKELADFLVVSIFVNPTQFGPGEDLERYPRSLSRDTDLCIAEGVDYLFTPEASEMYPDGPLTHVEVEGLSERIEGDRRPGHFRGVATVVLKLLQIVQPDVMALGMKDFQQQVILRRMARDLMLDVEIVVVPTVRDEDGVALSSRLSYLSEEQRAAAAALPRGLEAARAAVAAGERERDPIVAAAREPIEAQPLLQVEYIELADPETLDAVPRLEDSAVLLLAVGCGDTRLIDNEILEEEGAAG